MLKSLSYLRWTVFLFPSLQLLIIFFFFPNSKSKVISCVGFSLCLCYAFLILLSALKRLFWLLLSMCGVGTRFRSLHRKNDQSAGSSSLLHMASRLVVSRAKMTSRIWGYNESCVISALPFSFHVSFQFLLYFQGHFPFPFLVLDFLLGRVWKSKTTQQKGQGRSGILRGLLLLHGLDVMCGWGMCA